MVVKLTGRIDGKNITFERTQGDWWKATIPPNLSGRYIVDLLAADEAGNEAFWTRCILTVDIGALCVHLEPYPYRVELVETTYYATLEKMECRGVRR